VLALGVVVDVREIADAAGVGVGAAAEVEQVAGEDEAVDEFGRSQRRGSSRGTNRGTNQAQNQELESHGEDLHCSG
jgi:hypothetical protein